MDVPPEQIRFLENLYELAEGELDGTHPVVAYMLGFEMAGVWEIAESDDGGELLIHAANRERAEAVCNECERKFSLVWMTSEGDRTEDWLELIVEPRETDA